jgi:glycosyltransferase involved in cell wall biosynthesis
MARDRRFHFTLLQAIQVALLAPPITLFILLRACLLRLFMGKWEPPPPPDDDPSRWDVVCISHVHWRHIWQRNHHTMAQLARRSKVLYINPIRLDSHNKHSPCHILSCRKVRSNIWHCELFVLPFETRWPLFQRLNRFIVETRIRRLMRRWGLGPVVLWFYFPSQRWLVGRLGERAVVYDIQDEYSHFPWAPLDTAEKEKRLLAEADVVFTGTDALYERKRPLARHIHFFGCGVDFDHFQRLYYRDVPHEMRNLRGQATLGYFGAIDERIDRDLLSFLVRERPQWNLVMIGPIQYALFPPLRAPNVVFTGLRAYELLPRFLARFDVCLMPFAINELTRHINPTKALEYFASAKPVVSTPIPDMVKYYSDVIYFASTPEEFLAQCEACLADFPAGRRERGLQLARERSWESVVASMRQLIDEAIARKARR